VPLPTPTKRRQLVIQMASSFASGKVIVPGWLDYGRASFLRAYPQTPGLDDAGHRDDGMHPSRPYSGRTEVRLSSAPTRREAGAFAANDGLARLGSGGGTYLTVHLRPQV